LRLEVRRIRSGASQDRRGDVTWLDFKAPHRHVVVDVTVTNTRTVTLARLTNTRTVTNARTNTNVPRICARLPLPGSLALGAQHVTLDADLRTSALLGTPSV
jgi:hypothetical protein